MKDLKGKVAVITGGGSGLGRELALCCARRGMNLVLGDVDEKGMAETVELAGAEVPGVEAAALKVDVSRLEQVEALASLARDRFGAAHLLFNNAGVSVHAPIWENTVDDWRWVLGVNLYGVIWGIKVFMPLMLEQGEGHVVNTASAAGWMNMAGSSIYNVSKCSVVAMSETLANDIKDVNGNVGVTCLSPAFFPTPIADADRNRPPELGETAPDSPARRKREEMLRHAVSHGRISAAEIAEMTVRAVEQDRFYVFPHQKIKQLILARAQAVQDEATAFDPTAGR